MLLVGATARCLLDPLLEKALSGARADADLRRLPARSYGKDQAGLLADILGHLESSSLFGAERILVMLDGLALLKLVAIKRWASAPPPGSHLIVAAIRTAKDGPPKVPAGLTASVCFAAGPTDRASLGRWVQSRVEAAGCQIDAAAVEALVQHTGGALDPLVAELEKLVLYQPDGLINVAHVEDLAGHAVGQEFDRLWSALKSGKAGGALAVHEQMAVGGYLEFGGGRIYGHRRTAGALLPMLLSRIRRVAMITASGGKLRQALLERVGISPGYAHFLERDGRDLGPRRLQRWLAAAVAAEVAQKRSSKLGEDTLLQTLILELARP